MNIKYAMLAAAMLLSTPAMADSVTIADINARLRALETGLAEHTHTILKSQPAPQPTPLPQPAPAVKPQVSMCAAGCDAINFKAAYAMVAEGGVITVSPGSYSDCLIIKKSLTINGAGARVSGKACGEKAAFVVASGGVTLTGFDIGPVIGTEGNIACVRALETSTGLTLRGIKCHDTKMGVLAKVAGDVLIEDSSFRNFTSAGAIPHALYITVAKRFTLRNSTVSESKDGHLVKSGAQQTIIENSTLAALDSKTARLIDAYGGGELTVRNSVLQVRNNTSLHFMNYASEKGRLNKPPHIVLIDGNTFINDDARTPVRQFNLFRPKAPLVSPVEVLAINNALIGKTGGWAGWIKDGGTTRFASREAAGLPAYDGALASAVKANASSE